MRVRPKPEKDYPFPIRLLFLAQKRRYGRALEPSKLWGRSPPLLLGLQALYRAIDRKGSPIEPALRSLVTVRVSQLNGCSFCVDVNSALLLERGVTEEKILGLADFERRGDYSERERAALAYAEAMTRSPVGVTDELFARVRAQFPDEEIVELTAVIAYQNLSSRFNAALGVPSQGFCRIGSPHRGS